MFYHSRKKEDRMSAEVTNGANVSFSDCTQQYPPEVKHGAKNV